MEGSIYNKSQILLFLITGVTIGILSSLQTNLSLAIPFAFLFVFLAIYKQHIFSLFLISYVILFPKISVMSMPGTYVGIRGEDFLLALLVLLVVGKIIYRKQEYSGLAESPISKIMMVYIASCAGALIIGIITGTVLEPFVGVMFLFRKVEYFLFILVGYIFAKRFSLKFLVNFLHVLTYSSMAFGFLQQFRIIGSFQLGNWVPPHLTWRIMSMFSGPYEYSAFLVFMIPLYLWITLRKNFLFGFISLSLVLYSLYLTQARIAIVAAAFVVFVSILTYKNTKRKLVIVLTTAAISSIILMSMTYSGNKFNILPERFQSVDIAEMVVVAQITLESGDYERFKANGYGVYSGNAEDMSFLIRINKWSDLLDGFRQYPLFGLGLSSTNEAVDGIYVRYLAESGIIGFLSWMILILTVFKSLRHTNELSFTIKWGLIGLLVIGIFIDIFEASKIAMFLWFIVGYNIHLNRKSSEQ